MKISPSVAGIPDVFISSDQRCGGTALNEIARVLLDARCIDDPYSPNWKAREIPGLPCAHAPEQDPADCLDFIYHRWRCIKLCATCFAPLLYRPILDAAIDRGCRMALLYRENALQRAMSLEMARETRVFDSYDWTGRESIRAGYAEQRVELDISRLLEFVHVYQQRTDDVRALLARRVPAYLEIRYETLFGVHRSMAEKFDQLGRVCEYWGVDPKILETRKDSIERILLPAQKLNTPALYQRMVSNLDDIAAAFDPALHGDLLATY